MKRFTQFTARLLLATLVISALSVAAADKKAEPAKKTEAKLKPYPLNTCPVSKEKLGGDMGDPFVFAYQGREVKLCCKNCKADFDKETAKYVKVIDEAAKKVKAYTLKTCVVSDEKFGGDMGEPFVFIHNGREIKLCCKDCKKDFDKETAKFIAKLEKAEKKTK